MAGYLRKLFSCAHRGQQDGHSSTNLNYSGEIIYFYIPKDEIGAFLAERPQQRMLNISSFMFLYKYATNELLEKAKDGYMYEKFVLDVDGDPFEGWIPVPKLDLSWCNDDRTEETDNIHQKEPVRENTVREDIAKNVTSKEKFVGAIENKVFTGKALLMSKSERHRIRFLSYSRHMNPF